MNFDDIKKQWDSQSQEEINVNVDLEKVHEANSIIDNVRKVMKKDFFFQLTSFPMLLLYPFLFQSNTPLMWFIIVCFFAIMIFPLSVLVKFYKESYKMEFNSLKNLNWFYYNYKYSIVVFKVYSYITFILVVMFFGIFFIEKQESLGVEVLMSRMISYSIGLVIFSVFCVWMTKWWVNKYYAKPLSQIEQILDELES